MFSLIFYLNLFSFTLHKHYYCFPTAVVYPPHSVYANLTLQPFFLITLQHSLPSCQLPLCVSAVSSHRGHLVSLCWCFRHKDLHTGGLLLLRSSCEAYTSTANATTPPSMRENHVNEEFSSENGRLQSWKRPWQLQTSRLSKSSGCYAVHTTRLAVLWFEDLH